MFQENRGLSQNSFIFKVFTALLLIFSPGIAAAACTWSYIHSRQFDPQADSAYEACARGLASSYVGGYSSKLTGIQKFTASGADGYHCLVQLQACQTCNWTTPNPAWNVQGWDLTAVLVNQNNYQIKFSDVDDATGTCIEHSKSIQLGPSLPQQCSAASAPSAPQISPGESGDVGNPINAITGNKYQVESIYKSPSGTIDVSLFYNTYNPRWLHSYSDRLAITPNYIYFYNAQGRSFAFLKSGASITSVTAAGGVLTKTASGYELVHPLAGRLKFDVHGKMTEVTREGKGRITISYAAEPVQKLSVSVSIPQRKLTLTSEFGEVVTLNDDTIGGFARLSSGNFISSFGFYTTGMPALLIKSIGGYSPPLKSYIYGDSRFPKYLTAIYDERRVKYATWTYDAQGRAIASEHLNGADKVSITYNSDGSSTVTNPLGKKTVYRAAYFDGVKRITAIEGQPSANCPNSNSSFTYDARGLLKTKTDNKGNLTTFDYNERGLEISRTDASGTAQARTITTEWHPSLFLPLVVTEPNRIIRYQYDDQGRQLSQTVEAL